VVPLSNENRARRRDGKSLLSLAIMAGVVAALLALVMFFRRSQLEDHDVRRPAEPRSDAARAVNGRPPEQVERPKGSGDSSSIKDLGSGSNEDERIRRELSGLLNWWKAAAFSEIRTDEEHLRRLVQLINAVGKDALYEAVRRGADPGERWAAFSALCTWMSAPDQPLRTLGTYAWSELHDVRFMNTVEEFALDSSYEPRLKSLAIQAVWAFPPDRAARILSALLAQSGLEADVLTVAHDYPKPLPDAVRTQIYRRAAEIIGNPASDERMRGAAVTFFRDDPQVVVQLVSSYDREQSVFVKRAIASEATRLLGERSDLPAADSVAERLFGLALASDDAGVQINIVSRLGAERVRDKFGVGALKVLTTLAERDGSEEVRISAIKILGQGGYSAALDKLRELAKSSSPAIAQEAQSAIKKLGP
jgi:hypothetical protein